LIWNCAIIMGESVIIKFPHPPMFSPCGDRK
jgi:hypothetical protein